MSQPISREQINEWTENPVTIRLKEEANKELREIQQTPITDCLFPGKPHKSQENLVELEARERVWESWVSLLEGDWAYFEEVEDEQVD